MDTIQFQTDTEGELEVTNAPFELWTSSAVSSDILLITYSSPHHFCNYFIRLGQEIFQETQVVVTFYRY